MILSIECDPLGILTILKNGSLPNRRMGAPSVELISDITVAARDLVAFLAIIYSRTLSTGSGYGSGSEISSAGFSGTSDRCGSRIEYIPVVKVVTA